MYTSLKSYQIIISLLKQYNIKHLVLSAGTRNIPFVQSVENDPFFTCYSVVDERSAAYMALGLSLSLNEPVVISCTSSTATCNYFPAIAEAFHQGAQLIVLTSDRNPALLGQREDQMIDQVNMYGKFVKKAVNLPIVQTEEDYWYCERLVNDAILATNHHGKGPVQINIPMLKYYSICTEKSIPQAKIISRITPESNVDIWNKLIIKLQKASKILLIVGQNNYCSNELNTLLTEFSNTYQVPILAEYMANINCENVINPFLPFDMRVISSKKFAEYLPEIVISFGGNIMSGIKEQLRQYSYKCEHWGIEDSGEIIDMYKNLTTVFECSPEYFFKRMLEATKLNEKSPEYKDSIINYAQSIQLPELPYSNNTIIRDFAKLIPDNSILHLSINNSIRLINYFGLPNRSIRVFSNIGTHGIDGCLSSFIGQAITQSDKLSFLIIGDLSFFYDMGAMRIRHIPKTARILMVNNYGGGEFHYSTTLANDPTLDLHTSAAHKTNAKGWIESLGFKYYSAENNEEYQKVLPKLFEDSEQPIFIEAFSSMEIDALNTHYIEKKNEILTSKEKIVNNIKKSIKETVGQNNIEQIKKLIRK